MNDDERKAKAQETLDAGGLLTEEINGEVKVHIAIDPKNPEAIFDRLNEFEIELVKRAENDLSKVREAGIFVDDLRVKTRQIMKDAGI